MNQAYTFNPIGIVHSCYKEKFGIPRQPGLVKVEATIEMLPEYALPDAFRELETFSHLWLVFVFHQALREQWKPTVRPPRLGGNERLGVFASRSMFRPNPIGLSVVELSEVVVEKNRLAVKIIGADLLDGTPILDIKPYLPYADALPHASAGYAETAPTARLTVSFSAQAQAELAAVANELPHLQQTISEILQLDPRPAYQANTATKQQFAMRLYDFDLHWQVTDNQVQVTALQKLS